MLIMDMMDSFSQGMGTLNGSIYMLLEITKQVDQRPHSPRVRTSAAWRGGGSRTSCATSAWLLRRGLWRSGGESSFQVGVNNQPVTLADYSPLVGIGRYQETANKKLHRNWHIQGPWSFFFLISISVPVLESRSR